MPENQLIAAEEQAAQERALAALQQALAELPPDERLYIVSSTIQRLLSRPGYRPADGPQRRGDVQTAPKDER